jgi:hypothetical protein
VQAFDQLKVTYFQSGKTQIADLLQLYERMKKDQRVEDVSLHVVDRTVKPQ